MVWDWELVEVKWGWEAEVVTISPQANTNMAISIKTTTLTGDIKTNQIKWTNLKSNRENQMLQITDLWEAKEAIVVVIAGVVVLFLKRISNTTRDHNSAVTTTDNSDSCEIILN